MGDQWTEIDQMDREVVFHKLPERIISLVPSITEYLLDLGVDVVGRTKFCVHPKDKVRDIPIVGGTKHFKFERIAKLNPDLIVGNKEENYPEGIRELEKSFPIWMSDISTFEEQYGMMRALGRITGKIQVAENWIEKVRNRISFLQNSKSGKALYLIWYNPWMASGTHTYINSFLHKLGYENCLDDSRYPQLTDKQIVEFKPEIILLSSEPFPFKEKHKSLVKGIYPEARVELVNGELFSWYGSRIVHLQ